MTDNLLLDPTSENTAAQLRPRAKPVSLEGKTVALLDISKPRGDIFLNQIGSLLATQGATIRRYSKPTFTRPAPTQLLQRIADECDLVLEALAD